MSTQSSFNAESKQRIVEEYLTGKISQRALAQKYGVGKTTIGDWVRLFQTFGIEGLQEHKDNKSYSSELQHAAVRDYLSGTKNSSVICCRYGLRSDTQLHNWLKKYNEHQEDLSSVPSRFPRKSRKQTREQAQKQKPRGEVLMSKGGKTTYDERVSIVTFCIEHDKDYVGTTRQYGVSYDQIYSWVRKYERNGAEALADRRGKRKVPPAPTEMTELERLQAENKRLQQENMELKLAHKLLKKVGALEGM